MDRANAERADPTWSALYRAGGAAALLAGIVFRRNLAAEVALFGVRAPTTVAGWFALLQENRLLGLTLLGFFDVVDCCLVGLMLLALCAALRRANRGALAIAAACGFVGIAVYLASNTSLTLLSLSGRYAAATSGADRTLLLAAGQAVLAANQGTGVYLSLFLLAVAGLVYSVLMLQSRIFSRWAAYVGILAGVLDLAYCTILALVPAVDGDLVALCTLPAAGLLLMVWHILIGLKLLQLGRLEGIVLARRS